MGGFRAFDNACPHQHEPLHKGKLLPRGEVVCPLHHYRFNLINGNEAKSQCGPMNVYPVKVEGDGVYINI